MSTSNIINEALRLKPTDRFRVVESLLDSLNEAYPEIDRLLKEHAERRLAAHRHAQQGDSATEDIFRNN